LERDKGAFGLPTTVLGFVHNMPDLMRAADVVATKAGPGSICEAMACGLPIMLTGYIPGQEEGNIDYVLSNHIGVLARTPEKLVAAVRSLLTPGSVTLAEMRANSERLSYPRASFDIARLVLTYVPPVGAASAWANVPRSRRGRLSRALSHRNSPLRRARRVVNSARRTPSLAQALPTLRRGLGLPGISDARARLQRRPGQGIATSRRAGNGN
ncbi:MAG TPA: glycosyltransferase, partial [Ktedonobacterales bacterium]